MPLITLPATGQYGVLADQAAQELPLNAWSGVRNMRFRDGYSERFGGEAPIFTAPSITPYWLAPYTTSTARFWVHAGLQKVFVDDGTTRTEITPGTLFTGAQDDRWTGGSLNGVLVMNNGKDQPQFWGGNIASDLATLTGWNANWRAASVRPFKNYLVALDLTKAGTRYPHMVKWSHVADPGTVPTSWDESNAALDAGEQDLAETPDLLVDQLPLGDMNVVYKERSMYAMQYIGQPFIWRFSRLPGDVGMLARGCAVATPQGHVVLTAGDVILHSGQGPQSLLTGRMRRWLFNNLDSTNYRRAFVTANPNKNEVWVCFPAVGASVCTLALVWNWADNTLGVRDLANVSYGAFGQINYAAANSWNADTETWDDDGTAWNQDEYSPADARLLLAAATPQVLLVDTSATFNGAPIAATLERTGMAFDDPYSVKMLRAVYPRVDAAAGTQLSIEVGASMDAERAPVWQPPVTYTVGSSLKADTFATGRFLALRIRSSGKQPWRLKSIDLDIVKQGAY